MKQLYILLVFVAFISCKNDEIIEQITNPKDYDTYLSSTNNKTYTRAYSEMEFWSRRLRLDSTGVGDLGPLANAYTLLFETTGNVNYLKSAEKIYKKAISVSANSKDSYTRSLAHNFITQHRFKEAKQLLEESINGLSNKRAAKQLLFDVYLELGEYDKADLILGELKNTNDYNYLIRLAKWNDHNGNLDAAIRNLDQAKSIADSRKSKSLQIWVYTNLADYYSHAGRIKESYNLYLKTLKLQADNSYAKKQIAWIVFSYEKNTKESSRIIDSVMINHKVPDYYLFKSQISEFNKDFSESNNLKNKFIKTIKDGNYGQMYASYLIEVCPAKKAIDIAIKEIMHRPTPEIYSLFAYTQLKLENKGAALSVIRDKVEGKTSNPTSLYYSALIYKANDMDKKVKSLKAVLETAAFELGPLKTKVINDF